MKALGAGAPPTGGGSRGQVGGVSSQHVGGGRAETRSRRGVDSRGDDDVFSLRGGAWRRKPGCAQAGRFAAAAALGGRAMAAGR